MFIYQSNLMSASIHSSQAGSESSVQAQHFLVIDDDRGVRQFLRDFLRIQGCECEALGDKASAVDWLTNHPCDAIVLDLNLGNDPDEGFDALKQIRASYPALPIVILTGAGYDENKLQTAIHAGANGYISKTIPPDELFAALMRAVRTARV